ncbi:MAG: glycosyltransferase [Acidobacteriota bacterium]|nr:glycosyltransferase [Acidobacteriota bacterium]
MTVPKSNKLRVLHVIPSAGPQRGGPSFVIRAIARGLSDEGVSVDVATTNDNGPGVLDVTLYRPIVQEGATYRYFPRQTRFYGCSLPLAVWLWRHVADYDLVHIHALFSFPSTAAAIIARLRGVPYIVRPLGILNRWGMQNRRPFLKQLSFDLCEKRIIRHAYAVQFTSEPERLEAQDLGGNCRAVVIPNPVELPQEGEHALLLGGRRTSNDGDPVYLFLSRIDEKKGIDLLLEAFALVLRELPGSRLIIAGEGPEALTATLHALADRLGIEASVTWSGFVAGEVKNKLLGEADVYVLPSYSENFGVSVVEAMAAALPVVITDRVGIHPEISHSKAGLVTTCDAPAFAQGMLTLGRNPALSCEMGAAGCLVARRDFSVAAVARRLVELYAGAALEPAVGRAAGRPQVDVTG